MKDINQPISIKLPHLELYLDDLEEIIKIIKNENPTSIILETNGKEFEFEEINKLKTEKINNLKIAVHFSTFENYTITFDKYGVNIYCYEGKTLYQGLTKKIEDYLKNRKRLFGKIAISSIPHISMGALLPIMYFYVSFVVAIKNNAENKTSLTLIGLLLLILFIFSVFLGFKYKSIIYLKNRSEYKNFFLRNKDQIFVQLLVGLVILIIGFILGRLYK